MGDIRWRISISPLLAERPKIKPFKAAMVASLREMLGVGIALST